MSKQKGFTLIELMITIALAMMALAVGYVYFAGSNRASEHNVLHSEMQDNARIAMDVICRKLRMIGYQVDFSKYSSITIDGQSIASYVVPVNSSTGPDRLSFASVSRQIGVLKAAAGRGATTVTVTVDPGVTIRQGDVIGIGHISSARVLNNPLPSPQSTPVDVTINLSHGLESACPPGAAVSMPDRDYILEIRNDPSTGNPVLYLGTQPIAENIEDIQFAYGIDADQNLVIAATEWISNRNPTADEIRRLRLIRVTVIARTSREIKELRGQSSKIDAEDRIWGSTTPKDGYARIMLQRIVKCRNLSRV